MVGKTLDLNDYMVPDQLGWAVSNQFVEWQNLRENRIRDWKELRQYIYATDTTYTTNSKLPWKNKTTIPKITHIRDNLLANYMFRLFPKRKYLDWLADTQDANSLEKREAILAYMMWAISQPAFKETFMLLLLDYIDYGNCFATVEWTDQRVETDTGLQTGYVGPSIRRISPIDIVFNPTAPSFVESPKIVRSLITMGELKKKLDQLSNDENREEYKKLWQYFVDYREGVRQNPEEIIVKDSFYNMDGFSSYRAYLDSDYVEILTFYGDMFDWDKKELLNNHVIMIADRHKVISKKPNPSYFGYPPIFHCGWRPRQDNLWAMGPLDNLVGMQYRLDHIENLKSDVTDLIAYPVLKIKGYVNDFNWEPMARIQTDAEGDVEMLMPPFQILQINNEIQYIIAMMEEMAGAPKEAMGIRTPGEKTAFEVSKLDNASGRIFDSKAMQFEERFAERLYNAMLEMARRNIQGVQEINVFDDEFKIQTFLQLTADDITGAGRLKPIGARHFAERAELIQNLTNLASSPIGQDPAITMHFSGVQTAKMLEEILDIADYEIVRPFVRIAEQEEAKRLAAAGEEQTMMNIQQPTGITPEDTEEPLLQEGE
jgi:hypothetical protein